MKTLQERIELALAAGFSIKQLAEAAGATSAAASLWKSGATKTLKAQSAMGLARLTGWSAEWWVSGKEPQSTRPPSITADSCSDTKLVRAPTIEWARLGEDVLKDPQELGGAEVLEYVPIGDQGRRVKLVPVIDDSLAPRLIVGDMVAIDPDNRTPARGQVVLFMSRVDGQFFLRRYQPLTPPEFEAVDSRGASLDSKRHDLEIVGVRCGMRPTDI